MPKRREYGDLTPLQLEIVQILWERGEASVAEVHEALGRRGRKMAYTSAMTLCKRLADRGVLKYVRRGRAYIYSPARRRKSVLRHLLGRIVDRAFGGSEAELALTVLSDARMDADELEALQNLLAAKQRQLHRGERR